MEKQKKTKEKEEKEFERAERDKERAEREREKERAYELESIRLEKEVEVQRIRSEHEFKMAEMRADQDMEPDEDGGQGDYRRNGPRTAAMKALKLPPFNEDKDDLDAYLIRFETACVAFEVRPDSPEHWSTQLARLLQGKSLEVYHRLPDSDVERYDVLKA